MLAGAALVLALAPYLGRYSFRIDVLSAFLPFSPLLAMLALAVGYGRMGWPIKAAAMGALLLSSMVIVPELLARRGALQPVEGATITIVTHNLSRRNGDPQATVRMLAASDTDVLLLQEAHGTLAPHLSELARAYPYHDACPGRCDLSIYSRLPIDKTTWRLRDGQGKPIGPELLWTRLTLPGGGVATIATVHRPWTIPNHRQFYQRRALAEALRQGDTDGLILAGDFNLTPWGAGMRDFEDQIAPVRRATRGIFSFPARVSGMPWPASFLPIDHMFVGQSWRILSVERLERTGSDHYPIRVRLEWRPSDIRRATALNATARGSTTMEQVRG